MSRNDRVAARELAVESREVSPRSWHQMSEFFCQMADIFGYQTKVFDRFVEVYRPFKSKWNDTSGVVITPVRDYADLFDCLDL
jgi:hypothetical protein